MSAEAGFNFNDMSIRMGMNQSKSDGGGDGGNEKDIFDFLIDSLGTQVFGKATKLTGIPNMEGALNTGITKQFDTQGVHEKMINPMAQSFAAPGGFLYRMFSALLKNNAITDHTQGIEAMQSVGGGGDYADSGGGGGDSGGGSSSSGGNYGEASMADMGGGNHHSGIEPMIVEYGGRNYEVASMSSESLGNISPPSGGDASSISKGDIEIG